MDEADFLSRDAAIAAMFGAADGVEGRLGASYDLGECRCVNCEQYWLGYLGGVFHAMTYTWLDPCHTFGHN